MAYQTNKTVHYQNEPTKTITSQQNNFLKKLLLIGVFLFCFLLIKAEITSAQCSICTKTAQQLGEKPAKGLNSGIIYLAFAPYAIAIYIAFRWRKSKQ
jgi:hypothetical protein